MGTKIWLITGATSGFGRELATTVAARGDTVIATGRRRPALAGVSVTAIQPGTYGTGFVTTATVVPPDDVYAPTVGAFLQTVAQLGPDTVGDPREVVAAILSAADNPTPPLRIAVGEEARAGIRAALHQQLDELANAA
ncbi:hypothetical protein [Actinoplanes sp. HUAS TT8]|uniref:hypothetical protein n=1 Tax=Actinoplanes sp. HUAS TT8 TaxID=3447453 RepID=UPI003F527E95